MTNNIKEYKLDGESRYTLVMVAAKRARQLVEGAEPKVSTSASKPVTIALDEIAAGKIEYKTPNLNSIK
jgi:DNA-directed RNA polymerase subunit omega